MTTTDDERRARRHEGLTLLAELAERASPERGVGFDMRAFASEYDEEGARIDGLPSCGTYACLAGHWVAERHPEVFALHLESVRAHAEADRVSAPGYAAARARAETAERRVVDAVRHQVGESEILDPCLGDLAAHDLGLTQREAAALFYDWSSQGVLDGTYAAAVVRQLRDTGEVDWYAEGMRRDDLSGEVPE